MNPTKTPDNRFPTGTFTPAPQPAKRLTMLTAQSRLELLLILRNGEQILLTILIPLTMLLGLRLVPIAELGTHRIDRIVPGVMMVAVLSSAFTGQAIAVGFDRRYGALKRLGATALPRWGVIGGKIAAVLVVVVLQAVLLGVVGVALGWRPPLVGLLIGAVVIAVGTATCCALGLLLGGTLPAEVVLAVANIGWFALIAAASVRFLDNAVPAGIARAVQLLPSGALAGALQAASQGHVAAWDLVVVLVWGALGTVAAVRWFRFE